jgi:hypothetical protein
MGVAGPSSQVSRSVALDHVDEDVTFQVDQPGRVERRMLRGGGQKRGLVDPQLMDRADPVGVIDHTVRVGATPAALENVDRVL